MRSLILLVLTLSLTRMAAAQDLAMAADVLWEPGQPRYVNEFAGRHNIREMDTIDQMRHVVAGMIGKRLMYRELG